MLQFALSAGVRGNFQQPKLHCFPSTLFSKLQVAASHTLQTSYQYCAPLGNDNKYWTHETKSSHSLDPPARLVLKPGKKRERRTRSTDLLCRVVSDTIFSCSRTLCSSSQINSMELQQVVDVLKNMAAPSLAGSWDNVGLLLEPSPPHTVSKLLLTNDLTPPVMLEAVSKGVDMIVSYHPPIFAPLKRLTQSSWKERIIGACLERRIALYSPHTSWDAAVDGVNDWLIGAFDTSEVRPVEQTEQTDCGRSKNLTFWTTAASAKGVTELSSLQQHPDVRVHTEHLSPAAGDGSANTKVSIQCAASSLPAVLTALEQQHISLDNAQCWELAKMPLLGYGMGRVGKLRCPVTIEAAVAAIKSHLNLQHVRLAPAAEKSEIKTVAVCAGSGASVLHGVKADLYLTGEMSHHEILDAACKGTHVVLCDHSNTERGFLKVIQGRLVDKLATKVQVIVSEVDRDPLVVV